MSKEFTQNSDAPDRHLPQSRPPMSDEEFNAKVKELHDQYVAVKSTLRRLVDEEGISRVMAVLSEVASDKADEETASAKHTAWCTVMRSLRTNSRRREYRYVSDYRG